ncbi:MULTISPECIES: NmrA family NAD(P)-binding protein [Pseudomonadota]|uniref:NAD-dependent epimerase/dehydratase domain-containing protein n=1 Tax=Novosphingobium pentaromativorans TaxID=205844 RepID=A0A2W5Q839_9SPHN|nr:MAG: hypothetical protein DI555_22230 [Novosphingobium pentaromativorans]GFE75793.1 hypothetical protein NTCA1_34420 [Novosphingobium sp. TCA1]
MNDYQAIGGERASDPELLSPLFLTGGSGYLGRNLIRHFVARGFEVVALVRSQKSADVVRALGARPIVAQAMRSIFAV